MTPKWNAFVFILLASVLMVSLHVMFRGFNLNFSIFTPVKQLPTSYGIHKLETQRRITLKPETARQLAGAKSVYVAQYLLENPALCSSSGKIKVMVVVHSAPLNVENRLAIRRTWANGSNYQEYADVKTIFVLGKVQNQTVQEKIKEEHKQYGDILQGDFVDSYHNMTLKTVMEMKWLHENCKTASIIIRADDDVLVNMYIFLLTYSDLLLSNPNSFLCHHVTRGAIDRQRSSKWCVDDEWFRNQTRYPQFCQGFFVAMSYSLISRLYESSLVTPFFWLDDIYMFGLAAGNLPEVKYIALTEGIEIHWGAENAISCLKRPYCHYLAILLWSIDYPTNITQQDVPQVMEDLWRSMVQQYLRISVGFAPQNISKLHLPTQ